MRIEIATFLSAMLVSGLASASCKNPVDHVEQRQCSEREATRLSREVRAAQNVVRDKIATWEQEASYKATSLSLFNNAATQFKAYLARQCEFEASAAAGGNGTSDMRLECQIALYGAYLKSLQEQAAWFESPHA